MCEITNPHLRRCSQFLEKFPHRFNFLQSLGSSEDVNHEDCQELFSIVTRVMRSIGKWQVGNRSVPIQFARKRGPCVYQTTCQSFAHPIFHERLSQQCSATQIQSPSILLSLSFQPPPPFSNLMCVHVSTHARNRRERLRRRGRSQAVSTFPFTRLNPNRSPIITSAFQSGRN